MPANPSPFDYASTTKSVHDSLDAAFKAIPDGKRGAFLVIARRTDSGISADAVLAARIDDTWKVAGGVSWDGQHKASGEVSILGAW